SSLTRVGVYQPDRAWFEPYGANVKRSVDQAPYALVLGIWVDPADRIWVIGATADSQWVEGMGPEQQGEGGTPVRPLRDPALAYAGIIDVYDAYTGALLATHR